MERISPNSGTQKGSHPNQPSDGRVASLDQFRGYTILGMLLVNFIGGFDVVHSVFKHNDNYFSYADSIMPSFHFVVGYAFRLTMLKRLDQGSIVSAYLSYVRRSLVLIFLAVLLFSDASGFQSWSQFSDLPSSWPTLGTSTFAFTFLAQWQNYFAHLLKSQMWNTFAIIGATQLLVLPLVTARPLIRVLAMFLFGLAHAVLCFWFNWGFVRGDETNWMAQLSNTVGDISWDGGFLGPLCWAIAMLGGTLAYDVMSMSANARVGARRLFTWGSILLIIGYLLSCLTRGFDVPYGATSATSAPQEGINPFWPEPAALHDRPWQSWWVEPPFVAPPPPGERLENYWMMSKQIPTLSFILFATGFAFVLYAIFVWACDVRSWQFGVFRTFGTNPLLAYCLHEIMLTQFARVMPVDAPLWYCMAGLGLFFACLYLFMRSLEKAKVFIRL